MVGIHKRDHHGKSTSHMQHAILMVFEKFTRARGLHLTSQKFKIYQISEGLKASSYTNLNEVTWVYMRSQSRFFSSRGQ